MKYPLLATAIALVVACILTPVVRRFALRHGIVAQPGGRRVHTETTALMGGLGIYAGFMAAVVATVLLHPKLAFDTPTIGLMVVGTIVAVAGIVDDKYELPGWTQAATIVLAGVLLVLFGVKVAFVTNPFKGGHLMHLGFLAAPITVIWILMVTKAVDCMDGLDGLAGGIAAIASGTLMLMAWKAGPRFEMSSIMAGALCGASIGFLRHNYPPAKVFMGTIGAQFLGFMLAGISIMGAFKIATLVAVAAPILVLGVPLFDTTFVVLKRAATGKKIHEADKSHLHHRLMEKGLSHRQVIWFIYALTFAFCAAAYMLFSYVK